MSDVDWFNEYSGSKSLDKTDEGYECQILQSLLTSKGRVNNVVIRTAATPEMAIAATRQALILMVEEQYERDRPKGIRQPSAKHSAKGSQYRLIRRSASP